MSDVELFRPGNGSEGEWFHSKFCDVCECDRAFRDEELGAVGCDILARALMFGVDEQGFPTEWRYVEAKPTCTAFLPEGSKYPTDAMLEDAGQGTIL